MALKANALVSLAKTKTFLGISGTGSDTEVERLINTASQMIENRTQRALASRSHTEYFDGRRTNRILLRQYPVIGGPAAGNTKPQVFLDNDSLFGAETEIAATEYQIADGNTMLIRIGANWPLGQRNIKVVYEAGIGTIADDDIPSDLENACMELVQFIYQKNADRRNGVISKSKLGETIQYESGVPDFIDEMLIPYMRTEFALLNIPVINT